MNPPASPKVGQRWLDTSGDEEVEREWDGSIWLRVGARSHATDPETSKDAAEQLSESGIAKDQVAIVCRLVKEHPDKTASELAALTTLSLEQVRRRLTDAKASGLVRNDAMPSRISEGRTYRETTWRATRPHDFDTRGSCRRCYSSSDDPRTTRRCRL